MNVIISNVAITLLGISCIGLIFSIIILMKNNNTAKNRIIIIRAIRKACPDDAKTFLIFCDYMRSYDSTLWRLWDWGYTRILPIDMFEQLKPYIEEVVHERKRR